MLVSLCTRMVPCQEYFTGNNQNAPLITNCENYSRYRPVQLMCATPSFDTSISGPVCVSSHGGAFPLSRTKQGHRVRRRELIRAEHFPRGGAQTRALAAVRTA